MRLLRIVLACVLAAWCVGKGGPAAAQVGDDVAAARMHYSKAIRLYEVGEYRDALAEFKAAHVAKPDSAFLYNIAQCHRQLGDLDQALVMYKRYLVATPKAANRAEVEKRISDLEAELASGNVTKSAGGTRDGAAATASAPRFVAGTSMPGAGAQAYDTGRPPGLEPATTTATTSTDASAGSPVSASGSSLRTMRWVGVGVSLALVGAAIGTGLSASSKYDDLKTTCGNTAVGCDKGQIDSVKTRALATNVLWGLAGVAAVGTGIMFYLTPSTAAAQVAWRF